MSAQLHLSIVPDPTLLVDTCMEYKREDIVMHVIIYTTVQSIKLYLSQSLGVTRVNIVSFHLVKGSLLTFTVHTTGSHYKNISWISNFERHS